MGFVNTDELFCDGKKQKIEKSHCCICHRKIKRNKPIRGNCCIDCESRANKVARGLLMETESDILLRYIYQNKEQEIWIIDGVEYLKEPNGDLYEITTKLDTD